MLLAALIIALQVQPLPAESAMPLPAESATPLPAATIAPLPKDCIRVEPDLCPPSTQKRPPESACVRAAQADERCAQQTTGFVHYVALMRGGSKWGMTAGWYGRKTPRGRVYVENARRIFVQVAHDPAAPGTISDVARQTLRKIYGTDRPTATTPLLADRRRT
ncbi:MAG: hypothetical protein M3169_09775 [Candidatus Eremiobacteraeota bacterium]|nr:hypothetical protein [Candidatus Eremiobacteraeota bacterium]